MYVCTYIYICKQPVSRLGVIHDVKGILFRTAMAVVQPSLLKTSPSHQADGAHCLLRSSS